MALTRKHYEQFAKLLGGYKAEGEPVQVSRLEADLERLFEEDNPQFNYQTFEATAVKEMGRILRERYPAASR